MSDDGWQVETLHDDDFQTAFRCLNILHREKTEHQDLVLFENGQFGRMLMLDGAVQLTTADEFIYHEMMSHVPILAHGAARSVLVIGGGDGGVAREVLRHGSVERVVQVEIDESVVAFSKQYLPEISNGAFDDPRFELVIADGARFVAETEDRFDVIIVDSTDPIGPGRVLFSREFYAGCKRTLTASGVLVTQNGVPFVQADELRESCAHFRSLFADAWAYRATIPTYVGGEMTLGWATNNVALRRCEPQLLRERYAAAGLQGATGYYSPEIHCAAFVLPPYIERLVVG